MRLIGGLLHFHATVLITAGIRVIGVSRRLGHSTIVITQDTYTYALSMMHIHAVDTMERFWAMELVEGEGNDRRDEE